MYDYKTEIISTGVKLFSDKANEADVQEFNQIFVDRNADGWELVTYSYMATSMQLKGALLATFRKAKAN
ncbi:MAG: DUF4177 domain-containing protein [Defluviitaleaceae bacterium]|nr:DUF4177 domain-containing protein [Defluviitaleaceae bacterium]